MSSSSSSSHEERSLLFLSSLLEEEILARLFGIDSAAVAVVPSNRLLATPVNDRDGVSFPSNTKIEVLLSLV